MKGAEKLILLDPAEFKKIFRQIKKDFAAGEYPPYFVLRGQISNGVQQCFAYADNGIEKAYAVCAASHSNGYVLISLFSVYPAFRGFGIGTAFLEQLKERYAGKKGLLLEVEKPECARDEAERAVREKRMPFYARAGFRVVPNLKYAIWGVPMHLMACGPYATGTDEMMRRIHEIYLQLMGRNFIHKLEMERI